MVGLKNDCGTATNDAPCRESSIKHKATCVDLFAGCGGLSLGLERAGFRPVLFSELNKDAGNTYLANRKSINDLDRYGNIYNLNNHRLSSLRKTWGEIDLVAGGPPCQGFSGIGHRRTHHVDKRDIPSNHLYEEMIRVIRQLQPKVFLFENVRGLLTSKWDDTGMKIWPDVLSAFSALNRYTVRFSLVKSYDYGVPQNRPRVLLIGVKNSILPRHKSSYDQDAITAGLLPGKTAEPPDLKTLLDDLVDPDYIASGLVTKNYKHNWLNQIQQNYRENQNLSISLKLGHALREQEYSKHNNVVQEKFQFMIDNKSRSMRDLPQRFRTNKFSQRLLPSTWQEVGGKPNMTATSLPDDYIHYSQPRTLTVREWARLQGFPDWYEFCGKRTTGGPRRAGNPNEGNWDREVPKYTQIGNAVPVPLAEAVGNHILDKFIK